VGVVITCRCNEKRFREKASRCVESSIATAEGLMRRTSSGKNPARNECAKAKTTKKENRNFILAIHL
jgi:hypothetical protein